MGVQIVPLAATPLAYGVSGSAFQAETTFSTGGASPFVYQVPLGMWFIQGVTGVLLEYRPAEPASTARTMWPAGTGGMVWSDGYTVWLRGVAVAATPFAARIAGS